MRRDSLALFVETVEHIVESTRGDVVNLRPSRFASIIYARYGLEPGGYMSLFYRLATLLRPCLVQEYYETVYRIQEGRLVRRRRERAFTYWLSCVKEELRAVKACPHILYAVKNGYVDRRRNRWVTLSLKVDRAVLEELKRRYPHATVGEIVRTAIRELVKKWKPALLRMG